MSTKISEKEILLLGRIGTLNEEIKRLEKRNKEIYSGFMATTEELCEANKEIERLNNIINEIEKMMKNDLECACSMNENGLFNGAIDILEVYLDKLKELKGEDKE